MSEHTSPLASRVLGGDELLAALDKPALIVDGEGTIVQVNRAAENLCQTEETCVRCGAPVSDLLPGVDGYWPESGQAFDTEVGVECSELDTPVRVRGAPLCNVEGAAAGWLLLLQAEEGREGRSARRLRSLLASMDDLVFVVDLEGRIIEYHQPSNDTLAPSNGWMLGKSYQEVFPNASAQKFTEMMGVVFETERTHRFDHLLVIDGEERWYSANMGLLRDQSGQTTGFLVVARNITERKRIESAEREQRVLAEALQDVALALNSTLNLEKIWTRILANVVRVVPADAAAILLVEHGVARVVGERGYSERGLDDYRVGHEVEVASQRRLQYMTEKRQPCLIPDVRTPGPEFAPDLYRSLQDMTDRQVAWARSYLGAPILLDDDVIGFIKLESASPNYFTRGDAERLHAFGDHAASAIRNARLYAQAQELAAVQERQRLARDLHDAVSQMLFSAKIIAEMLPRLRDRDPDSVWQYLPELQRLIQGAMGEMRMLLLELRPGILTGVDLGVLVGYLVDAASARTSAQIALSVRDVFHVPEDVQIALYRIAQEALANAVKHAHAGTIDVSIRGRDHEVLLRIWDDGCGFDTGDVRPENLGLDIMRERAEEIDADLCVESVIGGGTTVEVVWRSREGGR